MNSLERRLSVLNPSLFSKFEETKNEVNLMLGKYSSNFPTYTDHSINHTLEVFKIASELLSDEEVEALDVDELYVLSMACILHDIGMCVPEERIKGIPGSDEMLAYKESHPNLSNEEFIRDIHHQLSNKFILNDWELLKIPSYKYAKAIGLVAEGHRKVELGNFDIYDPRYFAKSGKEYVCLPYLGCILRLADELDVTNSRTPKLLTKYYMPNNDISIREWTKHISTSQRNFLDDVVIFEVDCSDQNIYAALQDQFEKIQSVMNYCQKVIRSIPSIKDKHYNLAISLVKVKYNYIGFHPKGIKFSFDVQNVVTAFIGEDLYKDRLTSLREAIQNAIDSCRYKSKVLKEVYFPEIRVIADEESITIEDNGAGMDEFIVENFFGRLASSFYEQDKIKSQFEAIGQFGVGVFSYFLLSEFIDIETKTVKSNSLKFRFDKDPKSYFHFYDKAERTTPGTSITMHLKKDLIGSISERTINDYIKKTFKHIEIPIEVNYKGDSNKIIFQPFIIDTPSLLKDILKLQHKKIFNQLEIITVEIDNDDVEGVCGLIINKNKMRKFELMAHYFDHEHFGIASHRNTGSWISVCQKGVFVNYYSSRSLSMLIGDINLKKKIKINIDRNEFTNEIQIQSVIRDFEVKILKSVFSIIGKEYKNDEQKLLVTKSFLSNYSGNDFSKNYSTTYIDILKDNLYLTVWRNEESVIVSINDISVQLEEFIIISDKEDGKSIARSFNKPVVVASGHAIDGCFDAVINIFTVFFEYSVFIEVDGDKAYEKLSKSFDKNGYVEIKALFRGITESSYIDLAPSNSKKMLVNIWVNKPEFIDDFQYLDDENYFNINHFFIQFISKNSTAILASPRYKKLAKAVFLYLRELSLTTIDKESIKKLNEIIEPFNEIAKLRKLKSLDF